MNIFEMKAAPRRRSSRVAFSEISLEKPLVALSATNPVNTPELSRP